MIPARQGRRIAVRGTVQGVGFRPWVWRLARTLGVAGTVRNDSSGVVIDAFAPPRALDELIARLRQTPPPAVVGEIEWEPLAADGAAAGFTIVGSSSDGELRVSIPADLGLCLECEREIFDPRNRRYRYPFTNCTHCGPRFTITRDVPYDRPRTTMAPFTMCDACRREYEDPLDRRFHAQPNACPECGPRLTLLLPSGAALDGDPLALAARALADGLIVAVKGLGGFHVACDATSSAAVARLRLRKRRDHKPFAVMVRDLAAAEELAILDGPARELLASPERPIVLVRRRGDAIADGVAPGSLLGLMLAYTPLHHLLLADAARPLVMTSGNLADEPIAYRDEDALTRLGPIADRLLVHDRAIASRCDDSIARVIAGAPTILRRARGFVPRPIQLARPLAQPVLACGAQLKNTFCIGVGDMVYTSPHVGDLDNVAVLDAYEEAIAKLERFLGVTPALVAHDLHPDFLSTAYAHRRRLPRVAVQHHHAHVASVIAEHGLTGPVLGLAWDGMGYGSDGSAWGGELLLVDGACFDRVATVRPLALAGGDRAITEIWRLALALVDDAFDGAAPLDQLSVLAHVPGARLAQVQALVQRRLNAPLAHGVGRYFDAVAALALGRAVARYEGEAALALEQAVDPGEHGVYPFDLAVAEAPWQLDLRPTVRALVAELLCGAPAGAVAARFHNTLADGGAALVRRARDVFGRLPLALTGGCFQNAALGEGLIARVGIHGVYLNRRVAPGDGGVALGQTLIADLAARSSSCA